jgi:chromosome segregation ATPase
MILATSAGKSMSEIQKELLKADRVISTATFLVKGRMYNVEETKFSLYAFTVDDAKNMTKAFIEILTKIAHEKQPPVLEKFINERKQRLQVYRERIADTKKKLSEKEPELKPTESAYKTLKNTDYYRTLADTEALEKARETIAQMNKMLSILEIELSGIQEKLGIIEKYRESYKSKFSNATMEKLEQMFVEQMVELRGAMGRKEAAINLRNRDKQFCDFFNAWTGLDSEVKSLRNSLRKSEERVRSYEEEMANPHPQLLPPKVLQNKVSIYPL